MFRPVSANLLREFTQSEAIQGKVDQDFILRLSANFHSIYQLVEQLYGSQHDVEQVMRQFVEGMLYVDRFAGNLKNVAKRIDYFEELGVNLVHLMPLLKCPPDENDGGYAVSDFRTVEPSL